MEPRLHINTGAVCNNSCIFCAEGNRRARARMIQRQSPEELDQILASFPSREHVCFTTGEPTLSPLLPWLLGRAVAHGYEQRALITNGRRLADPALLDRLLGRGLNLLTISLHGAQPQVHDRITRAPGSFKQTVRAIQGARGRLQLHSSTVLCRLNLPSLRSTLALLGKLGVDQAVLNVAKPRGRAEKKAKALLASHGEVADTVAQALASLGSAAPEVFVEDIPMCATDMLPDPARGALEHNIRFDRESTGKGGYTAYDRERTEKGLRTKRADCARCRFDRSCPGPWATYIEVFGWTGLDPL